MREITILSLIELALKHILSIVIAGIVFALAAIGYCSYIAEPLYSASGAILVTNGAIITNYNVDDLPESERIQNTDIITSLNFIPTAEQILQENGIYKELSQKLDNKYTYGKLSAMSSIKSRGNNSLYIDVSFSANSENEAVYLVNEFMDIIPSYFEKKVTGVAISYDTVDSAAKISPRPFFTAAVAAIVGMLIVYFIHFAIFMTNTSIKNEDDFRQRFDVPVIGSIPDFSYAKAPKSYGYNNKYV